MKQTADLLQMTQGVHSAAQFRIIMLYADPLTKPRPEDSLADFQRRRPGQLRPPLHALAKDHDVHLWTPYR